MQASPEPTEAGGGYATRRGHVPHLSISDPSHHVTEAIGHMYDDDYDKRDSRRLSYISSPLSESISIIPPNRASSGTPSSPQSLHPQNHLDINYRHANGQTRPSTARTNSIDSSPTSPSSMNSPATPDTATTSFPLNDIDYESNPAAVAQELSNLAAIRRMSMDVTATGDPDLPSFGANISVPSIAPSPSADENDTSRLFWVPARLHPELAPKEFKSFLESKAEHIKRRSGDFSLLSPERSNSNGSLRRKRSMLSKQIDNPQGYTDGAERLERQRSQKRETQGPNLQQLETIVDDSNGAPAASSIVDSVQNLGISPDEDKPILPPAPPGHSLRRATRTQYRKAGSLRKGERPPYSKRHNRASETSETLEAIVGAAGDQQPILGLTRVSTDPTPSVTRTQALARAQGAVQTPNMSFGATFDSIVDFSSSPQAEPPQDLAISHPTATSQQSRQWQSRTNSNGRPTPIVQPPEQKIPEIIETPPVEASPAPSSSSSQSSAGLNWNSSHDSPPSRPPLISRARGKESTSTLNDFANNPQPLPGNTTRTDSLSFIPTLSEDRKAESKKKKDSEGGRKSSWHWLLGSEDKEKDKKKDKESDTRRIKSKIVEKVQETAHVLPSSSDTGQRGRESAVFDRLDTKLEEERRKDNVRRSSGESKKEKDGLFSSIFGGGRKKNNGEHHHKKTLSRTLSPDPPIRELKPDIDYAWTRFSILEERAIYRMAHIKLANPRRALYSQVLLSNFMYSYLAKVQQMHPHMMLATSSSQRLPQKTKDQPDEYLQYQRYQEAQEQQQYSESSYDDSQMYEYNDDPHNSYQQHSRGSKHQGYENGNVYGPGHYQYNPMTFGDDVQLDDDDDDDMW